MLKIIAVAALGLTVTTAAQALPRAPLAQPEGTVTKVLYGCGVGWTRVRGVCVRRARYYGYGYGYPRVGVFIGRPWGWYGRPWGWGWRGGPYRRAWGWGGYRRPYWGARRWRRW